jgi:predicted GH43/DUF377 family glycosyl hydrolase
MFIIKRDPRNPLLRPLGEHPWEALATFNWSPIKEGKKTHVFYRAMSAPDQYEDAYLSLSTIGHTVAEDGVTFSRREQFIIPEYPWEKYGCEDPRVTKIGNSYYIFYTALGGFPFGPDNIKVGVAITKDLKKIEEKHLVTPFNAKAMALFPDKVDGKYAVIFAKDTDRPPSKIAFAFAKKIEDFWSPEFWADWEKNEEKHIIDPRRDGNDHAEIGAAPIFTKEGWLLIYSHAQNYFSNEKIWGIEALLLDLKKPQKIIGRTPGPLIVPEEVYEKYGQVPNTIFPSGALVNRNELDIYYGATDTTAARATVNLQSLIANLNTKTRFKNMKRYPKNPILKPISTHKWESRAVFNPAAIDIDGTVHILYRAMSEDNTSTIGYASSKDGLSIKTRLPEPIYVPREEFELKKGDQNGNSGCEDPRLTRLDDKVYMCYTAYDGVHPPVVASSNISVKDFTKQQWSNWSKPVVVTPIGLDDKDTCLLSEKVNGKYMILHRLGSHICADFLNSLNFEIDKASRCIQLLAPRPGMWDSQKVGIAAPPLKTKHGWILLYHGVSKNKTYRVGAAMLDLKDPTTVLSRTVSPLFEPTEKYEQEGQIGHVVFPCGAIIRKGMVYVYYGGGDSVVGVATIKLTDLVKELS